MQKHEINIEREDETTDDMLKEFQKIPKPEEIATVQGVQHAAGPATATALWPPRRENFLKQRTASLDADKVFYLMVIMCLQTFD